MRMKYALSARESCAGILASFTNDARARQMRVDTRDLPEAQVLIKRGQETQIWVLLFSAARCFLIQRPLPFFKG